MNLRTIKDTHGGEALTESQARVFLKGMYHGTKYAQQVEAASTGACPLLPRVLPVMWDDDHGMLWSAKVSGPAMAGATVQLNIRIFGTPAKTSPIWIDDPRLHKLHPTDVSLWASQDYWSLQTAAYHELSVAEVLPRKWSNLPKGIELMDPPEATFGVVARGLGAPGRAYRELDHAPWHNAPRAPVAVMQRLREEMGFERVDDEFARRWLEEWDATAAGTTLAFRLRADIDACYNLAESDEESYFPYTSCMTGRSRRTDNHVMEMYDDFAARGYLRVLEAYDPNLEHDEEQIFGHLGRVLVWYPDGNAEQEGARGILDRTYSPDKRGTNQHFNAKIIKWAIENAGAEGYCYDNAMYHGTALTLQKSWSVPIEFDTLMGYTTLPYTDSVGYLPDKQGVGPSGNGCGPFYSMDCYEGESNCLDGHLVATVDGDIMASDSATRDVDGEYHSSADDLIRHNYDYYPQDHHQIVEYGQDSECAGEFAHEDDAIEIEGDYYTASECVEDHAGDWILLAGAVELYDCTWAVEDDAESFEGDYFLKDSFVRARRYGGVAEFTTEQIPGDRVIYGVADPDNPGMALDTPVYDDDIVQEDTLPYLPPGKAGELLEVFVTVQSNGIIDYNGTPLPMLCEHPLITWVGGPVELIKWPVPSGRPTTLAPDAGHLRTPSNGGWIYMSSDSGRWGHIPHHPTPQTASPDDAYDITSA